MFGCSSTYFSMVSSDISLEKASLSSSVRSGEDTSLSGGMPTLSMFTSEGE